MPKNRDERYMQVARACLKVLNNVSPATDRDQQIKEVYQAIDLAIADLYKQQEVQLAAAFGTLRQIAELDPARHSLEQAIELARQITPVQH